MKAKGVHILIMLLIIALCTGQHVFAGVYIEYEYKDNEDGGVTIVKYFGNSNVVNIPSEIDGRKVTRIGDNVFAGITYITDVMIPDTVTHIGTSAFWNVNGLKSITIPNSVKFISEGAFAWCFGLKSVNIGTAVDYIASSAFTGTPFYNDYFGEFDSIGDFTNGVFVASKGQKFGLIDLKRNVILPFEYERILPSANGFFEVYRDGKWLTLDSNFRPVTVDYKSLNDTYRDLKFHLEMSEIVPEETAGSSGTIYHNLYGVSGIKKDLIDYKGNLNIVYEDTDRNDLYIARFDEKYRVKDTIKIIKELPLFGTAICDEKGNYYIIFGAGVEEDDKDAANVIIAKYDYTGKKLGQASYIAGKMSFNGTKVPFSFGSVSMAISGNILAAHFSRLMFQSPDGLNHQSSTVVYADINTMTPVDWPIPYSSHSFDQYIVPASDGGFILEDRGDAYSRGFTLTRVTQLSSNTFTSFHFSETQTYQYTRSELGGLAESTFGYILAASSINQLTYTPIPESEVIPRNIFVQVIKKNFMHHSKTEDMLVSKGVKRTPIGRPGSTGLNLNGQSYFLPEGVEDHGVVWLTDYSGTESATNPKMVKLEQDAYAVLWEKYNGGKPAGTYYAIVDGMGNILKAPTLLPNAKLTMEKNPLYIHDEIVWSVINPQKISVYRLKPGSSEYTILEDSDLKTYYLPHNDTDNQYIVSQWAVDGLKRALEVKLPQEQLLSDFQSNITREEFCELVVRLYDLLSTNKADLPSSNVFNDTNNPYVLKAHGLGIVNGVGEGRFAPKASITRQEIAVMYERLLNALKIHPTVSSDINTFADENDIASWAKSAMQLLNKMNIITGVGANKVAPLGNVTREQALIMSVRLLDLYKK